MNFGGEENVLHNMSKHATKGWFSQGCSSSKVKEIGFPSIYFPVNIVYNKLEVSISESFVENGENLSIYEVSFSLDG